MKDRTFFKATAVVGIAIFVIGGVGRASQFTFSLFDPDPQPVNGTIPTAALSMRTPGGTTPLMNDLTGRGYPDTTAYYDPDAKLTLPPLMAEPHDGKIYFHHGALTPPSSTQVRIEYHKHHK